jgi:F0F1-type ATP synthase assembly protein I
MKIKGLNLLSGMVVGVLLGYLFVIDYLESAEPIGIITLILLLAIIFGGLSCLFGQRFIRFLFWWWP